MTVWIFLLSAMTPTNNQLVYEYFHMLMVRMLGNFRLWQIYSDQSNISLATTIWKTTILFYSYIIDKISMTFQKKY